MIIRQKKILLSDDEVRKLSEESNQSFILTKILVERGYDTKEKIQKFLSPSLSDLHDPFLLNGMKVLTEKISDAIKNQKRVLIFGDYDVDGISATAILYKYLKSHGLVANYFLPNRYEDGYGLTLETAKKVIELFNPQLVITVDCGISCHKEVDYLISQGVDVVVTDHHEIPQILPNCPIVNAKMQGQDYPFRELCGAGVALKTVQAMGEDLTEYLPICAIATIADIVSLTDENRAIVTLGLQLMKYLPTGLKMLCEELGIKNYTSSEIAFKVAPKINASGRMGDASVSLQLYIQEDPKVLEENLQKLTLMNQKRQELCGKIFEDCLEKIKHFNQNDKRAIIMSSPSWDSGLLGIVCARLTDEFNKPTFLFSEVDGLLKGSVRSIPNINIHEILCKTSTLLETFGGHSMAAGLTLKKENLNKFNYEIENYLFKDYSAKEFIACKEYDAQLEMSDINQNLMKQLEALEPCGCGNPKPMFYSKFSTLKATTMKNYPQHLNITTPSNFSFLSFNNGHLKDLVENSYVVELIYELQQNEFRKKIYTKGLVKNIKCSGYKESLHDYVSGNYLEQLQLNKSEHKNPFSSYDNLIGLLTKLSFKSNYGTLIICNNLKTARDLSLFLYTHNYDFYFKKISGNTSNNAIVVGLNSFESLDRFSNFVFAEPLLNMDYLNNFYGNLFLPKDHEVDIKHFGIDCSHNSFGLIYKKLVYVSPKLIANNKYEYYTLFKKLCPEISKITYAQFVACVSCFRELNFLTENYNENYSISLIPSVERRELTESVFYNRLVKLLTK